MTYPQPTSRSERKPSWFSAGNPPIAADWEQTGTIASRGLAGLRGLYVRDAIALFRRSLMMLDPWNRGLGIERSSTVALPFIGSRLRANSTTCQNGGGWQSLEWSLANVGESMPWRRFGVPIAVIVLLFALGRITSVVVDWAWFSSIGHVGVFVTAFVTKAVLFISCLCRIDLSFSGRMRRWRTALQQGRGYGFRRCSIRASRPFRRFPGH